MVPCYANEETTHFVNWVLLCGKVDPAGLVREAKENVEKMVAEEPLLPGLDHETLLATALETMLAAMLDSHMDAWAEEACPGFGEKGRDYGGRWRWGRDYNGYGRGSWPFPDQPKYFAGSGTFHLIAPLLTSALNRINKDTAARLILQQVSPAEVRDTCPSYFERGFNWAKSGANNAQLSRIAKFAKEICPSDWDRWFDGGNDAFTAAERLFFVLEPSQDGDRETAAKFWVNSPEWHEVQEFAEGALQYAETPRPQQRGGNPRKRHANPSGR